MKVAILSESSADQAAVEILAGALLGRPIERVGLPLRTPPAGWPRVLQVLPNVIPALHYGTDAEALIVVADSDYAPLVGDVPDPLPPGADRCRLRLLRDSARRACEALRPAGGRDRIRVAIGVAVPTVEAWYLCGIDSAVSEHAWLGSLGSRRQPYTKLELKRRKYDTDRPQRSLGTERAVENARRLAGQLNWLEKKFPRGFGALAADVRSWRR